MELRHRATTILVQAEVVMMPYCATTVYKWREVEPWCDQNIGEWNRDWTSHRIDITAATLNPDHPTTYCFRTQAHRDWFLLRWS